MYMSSCCTLCHGAGYTLCMLYMRERELQLAGRENALLELERRWKRGERWPQTSKTHGLSSYIITKLYTHSLVLLHTGYPKIGRKQRKRRRRKRPQRAGAVACTDAGSHASSSNTTASGSTPTPQTTTGQSGASRLSTVSVCVDVPTDNI